MIQIKINEESELYNCFDPARRRINDGLYKYLKSFCTDVAAKKHTFDRLEIICDAPVDVQWFKEVLRDAVRDDQEAFNLQISENNRRAAFEYVAGIGLSVAGFVLSYIHDQILLAMISFFGSMFLRDAVTISTELNPDIRHLKSRLDPLLSCEIEVRANAPKTDGTGRAQDVHGEAEWLKGLCGLEDKKTI